MCYSNTLVCTPNNMGLLRTTREARPPNSTQRCENHWSKNSDQMSTSSCTHSCIHKNAPIMLTVTFGDISAWLITKFFKHYVNIIPINSGETMKHSFNSSIFTLRTVRRTPEEHWSMDSPVILQQLWAVMTPWRPSSHLMVESRSSSLTDRERRWICKV